MRRAAARCAEAVYNHAAARGWYRLEVAAGWALYALAPYPVRYR